MRHEAIYALYPNVVTISDAAGAFDINGNSVEIDETLVAPKAIELQAAEAIKVQAAIDAKQSALAKLAALGLTADEIKALVG
jgi:hypothetical protein